MSLDKIRDRIESDARNDAERIRAEAKRKADHILGEAERHAKRIRERAEGDIDVELKRLREEYQTSITLAIKDMELDARERALSSSLEDVKEGVIEKARASKLYQSLFDRALKHAAAVMPAGALVVATNKADAARVQAKDSKREVREMSGGVVISSGDGTLTVNASLDKLIELNMEVIKDAMLKRMTMPKAAPAAKAAAPKAKRPAAKAVARSPAGKGRPATRRK